MLSFFKETFIYGSFFYYSSNFLVTYKRGKMVYRKYIWKNGRRYGPYVYHSRRVDGKVVSDYHGAHSEGKNVLSFKTVMLMLLGVVLVAGFIFGVFFYPNKITGNVVANVETDYNFGEPLGGVLKFSLKEGELIPASSQIVFENNGQISEFVLSDFVEKDLYEGEFYIEDNLLSDSGVGYGVPGQKEVHPKVSFTLLVYSSDEEASNIGEVLLTGEMISEISKSLGVDGLFSLNLEEEINGEISYGEEYVLTLDGDKYIEIKKGSVVSDGKELSESDVDLKIDGNKVSVSTDYSVVEPGFGEEYLGEIGEELEIDLSEFNLALDEGDLKISILYGGEELYSVETVLEGDVGSNTDSSVDEIIEEPIGNNDLVVDEPVEIIEESVEEVVVIIEEENIGVPPQNVTLSEVENFILKGKFGDSEIKTTKAVKTGGRVVVRFELKDFWIEHSYDAENSEIEQLIENDRIKWLKDLAVVSSQKPTYVEQLDGLMRDYQL